MQIRFATPVIKTGGGQCACLDGSRWEFNWTVVVSNSRIKWHLTTNLPLTRRRRLFRHVSDETQTASSRRPRRLWKESLQSIPLCSTLNLREMSLRNMNAFADALAASLQQPPIRQQLLINSRLCQAGSVRSSLTNTVLQSFCLSHGRERRCFLKD